MKQTFLALALLSCAVLWVHPEDATKAKHPEDAVLKAEQQWEDALTKSDAAALEKLYDDKIVYTHSNGKVDTKTSYINTIKAGTTKYESMKRDDIQVTLYGQTAVVTCHWDVHIAAKGSKTDMNARYLHVYVKEGGAWKLVAHQSTRVSP